MFRRMRHCNADGPREYSDSIAEIQSLLAATDPAAAELTRAESARLSVLGEEVTAAPDAGGQGRTWWPARQCRQHRQVLMASIAVPALLAGTAAGWVIAASPSANHLTNAVVCYSLPHPPENGISENGAGGTDPGVGPVAFCAR